MPRGEFETIARPQLSPEQLADALDSWARAVDSRAVEAVVFLLKASGLAESWESFAQHLEIELYTDPEDPDPTPYQVARVLDWGRLHNAIPAAKVGRQALGLFTYARMLGDRSFSWCLNDLLDGMEPNTQRLVQEANAVFFGLPRQWGRRKD